MVTNRERGKSILISKELFVNLAYAENIDYKKTKKGKKARNDEERMQMVDTLTANLTIQEVKAKAAVVLERLNAVGQYLVPIRRVLVEGISL